PDGGKIGRADGVLTGYLEEMAFTKAAAQIPAPSRESQMHAVLQAQRIYLQHGITTIQEGFAHAEDWSLLHEMADNHSLQADVVCYLDIAKERSFAQKLPRDYFSHLRLGGYKLFLDGSPQGRTAWMTSPYEDSTDGYLGYPIHTDEALHCWVDEALEDGMQLLAHCNGDAAAQQWIDAYRIAREAHPTSADIRPVMIHAQLVRPDQLAQMASLSMIASFFVQHVYHFGDTHVQNFGLSRAEKISPTRSAIENGVCYTFHQDTPVLPPDMLESIWCATQRITRSGRVLGACERITAWEAL
ncbi:MAG: amidohydrolase family protein, partial [Clostridia bacterium]